MPQTFKNIFSNRPDGTYISFALEIIPDDFFEPEDYLEKTDPRYLSFQKGDWYGVGIRATANIFIVENETATIYRMTSPGLWGIESDSPREYYQQIFEDEKALLKSHLEKMHNFTEEPYYVPACG